MCKTESSQNHESRAQPSQLISGKLAENLDVTDLCTKNGSPKKENYNAAAFIAVTENSH